MNTYLPQNYASNDIDNNVAQGFVKYLNQKRINQSNEFQVQRAWGEYSNKVQGGEFNEFVRVDGLVPDRTSDYKLYENGPFSWQSEDIISATIPAGSEIQQWIPTVPMGNYKYEVVDHLEWIAPRGWDGDAYSTWLAGLDIPECGYGPTPKWNAFSYQVTYGEFSFQTDTFSRLKDLAIPFDYRRSPKFILRGPATGLVLDNDVDFNVAILGELAVAHQDWILNFGALAGNPKMQWDGLDTILTAGYVAARYTTGSTGVASGWLDPLIVSGAGIADIATLIGVVRRMVRTLRNRSSRRKLSVAPGDMIIRMPLSLWTRIAEWMAVNGSLPGVSQTEYPGDAMSRADALIGNPVWMIDGRGVPVFVDDNMAIPDGNEITTDIQILTRRVGGVNILEQRFVDFSKVKIPPSLERETTTGLNGIMRYGWVEENKKCFYYFLEMAGMLVTRSQPHQGVITSYTYTLDAEEQIEANTFTDGYYANYGTPGSIGAGSI